MSLETTEALLSTIAERLERRPNRPGILVAWSGGLDSTALLHLLMSWSRRSGETVAAVHVDHQLRGSSRADRAFCQRMAHRWGVPLLVETLDVHRRGSIQESARVQRYAAIARSAQTLGLGCVATAHHANDAVETALLNFRRGTSAAGLSSGISPTDCPTPSWPDLQLLRPLSKTPRREILAYADTLGLEWQTDPTNAKPNYERNRLRQEIMPALTGDGDLLGPMLDTLENLASERCAIEAMADECLTEAALSRPDAESVALDCESLRSQPKAVIIAAIQKFVRLLPAEVGLGRDHLQKIVEAIMVPVSVEMDIVKMDTVKMAVRGGVISMERGFLIAEVARGRGGKHLRERVANPVDLVVDNAEGATPWFGTQLRVDSLGDAAGPISPPPPFPPPDSPQPASQTTYLETASADAPYVVRGPRPGDRLDARAMQGHKSVSDVLAEAGVPPAFRWRWPVVARDDETRDVHWICGLRCCEDVSGTTSASGATSASGTTGPSQAQPGSRVQLSWHVDPSSVFARVLARSQYR